MPWMFRPRVGPLVYRPGPSKGYGYMWLGLFTVGACCFAWPLVAIPIVVVVLVGCGVAAWVGSRNKP